MEKVIIASGTCTDYGGSDIGIYEPRINCALEEGWKVKSVTMTSSNKETVVVFVLERDEAQVAGSIALNNN